MSRKKIIYVTDEDAGYSRKRWGRGFIYLDQNNKKVNSKKLIKRFKELVIPPAWEDVWICKTENGHIQVSGRDEKGRKQYIYHPLWLEQSQEKKFNRLIEFGENLPLIRKEVNRLLRKRTLVKEKVIGIILRLMEETLIRIGNPVYARKNKSYGLTTLRNKHIKIKGDELRFEFKGKSGKEIKTSMSDERLAKQVNQIQELSGQHLFQYYDDDGNVLTINSADVNEFLHKLTGHEFTAKDFRTWGGSVIAVEQLYYLGKPESEQDAKKNIVSAVKNVAKSLYNTPAICREYYIHPAVIKAYEDQSLFEMLEKTRNKTVKNHEELDSEEIALLNILKKAS